MESARPAPFLLQQDQIHCQGIFEWETMEMQKTHFLENGQKTIKILNADGGGREKAVSDTMVSEDQK